MPALGARVLLQQQTVEDAVKGLETQITNRPYSGGGEERNVCAWHRP
jgi:hypothetical protein